MVLRHQNGGENADRQEAQVDAQTARHGGRVSVGFASPRVINQPSSIGQGSKRQGESHRKQVRAY